MSNEVKMNISEAIRKERPHLSDSTVKTYTSILNALHRKIFNGDVDMDNFKKTAQVLKSLQDKAPSTRKTTLSALYIITALPAYKEQMMEDIKVYKEDVNKQEMTEKQKASFKTQDEIKTKLDALREEAEYLLKKPNKTSTDINRIQNWIILALTSGVYIPPRRSLDWVAMVVNPAKTDKAKDNYMDKGKFFFNRYKGSAEKGPQVIDIPKPLQLILKKWLAVHDNDTLLFNVEGRPLNNIQLTQRLNSILGAGSAINVLRHSYLSSKYQDSIKQNAMMEKDLQQMGSGVGQSKIYIQKM